MTQQSKFSFKPELVGLLNEKRGAWPPHSKLAALLCPWRGTGMKRATYTRIRAGGKATRKDISDLLKLVINRAYEPFSTIVNAYLSACGSDSESQSLDALFEATTAPSSFHDYMELGGSALFELLPRFWANPCNHVAGLSTTDATRQLANWIRTIAGRQAANNESLSPEDAGRTFTQTWGDMTPDFDRQFSEWSDTLPWTVVYSGDSSQQENDAFVPTGGNVVLPLCEKAYADIASGHRYFADIRSDDLQVPCFGVYLYATCESPMMSSEDATRNSLTAMMWQIAALTENGRVRALAPSPIKISENRLRKSGFQQIGVCDANMRRVALWETHSNWVQRFILDSMRGVLRSDGFLKRPPIQHAVLLQEPV